MKYAKEVTDKTSGHEEPHTVLDYLEKFFVQRCRACENVC